MNPDMRLSLNLLSMPTQCRRSQSFHVPPTPALSRDDRSDESFKGEVKLKVVAVSNEGRELTAYAITSSSSEN